MRESLKLTYRDYQLLPDDGRRYEILDGELRVTPSPSTVHARISRRLVVLLDEYARTHPGTEVFAAPFDVVLSETTVVQPDICVVGERGPGRLTPLNLQGPPLLAIEILSPATAEIDRTTKRKLYAQAGVEEYWLIDPEGRQVEIYYGLATATEGPAMTFAGSAPAPSRALPGFAITPSDLWSSAGLP